MGLFKLQHFSQHAGQIYSCGRKQWFVDFFDAV